MTNRELHRKYRRFNRSYFGNKLPKTLITEFVNFKNGGTMGRTLGTKHLRPKEIQISNEFKNCPAVIIPTLLHEMVHAENPKRRGHGEWFDVRMLKLAIDGAFNGIW